MMLPLSDPEDDDDDTLEQLVVILEAIEIGHLKQVSYKKYINQLFDVSSRSISIDGARLSLIIQHIKSYREPCFQRDAMLDVLDRLLSECLPSILTKPFKSANCDQWSELACSIATIPDLVANCKVIDKFPHLRKEPFYSRLIEQVYAAIEVKSDSREFIPESQKLFLLKLLGRIAITGSAHTVWDKFTRRALHESKLPVHDLCRDILQLAIKPPNPYTTLELFVDNLILPIFSSHKPKESSALLIRSLLVNGVTDSKCLRYLICDKSLFQTNYDLSRERQSIILFNIAAYLSTIMVPNEDSPQCSEHGHEDSLLVRTLLEIVQNWTNPTKILIRTYAHTKYIACALLVFLRYASSHDGRCLASHAVKIQSMIINSLPIYLNRAAQEQRNLACCLCELILPKLRDEIVKKEQNHMETGDFELNFKVDLSDDLRHMRSLFIDNIGVIFQYVADDSPLIGVEADNGEVITTNSTGGRDQEKPGQRQEWRHFGDKQSKSQASDIVGSDENVSRQSKDNASTGEKCVTNVARALCDEQDLVPYDISESDDSDGDDEFEAGHDAASVPIYLSDCIAGLIENNNHRYVRLCLIRAGTLIESLIGGNHADDALVRGKSVCLAGRPGEKEPYGTGATRDDVDERIALTRGHGVNETIRDLGVELARTLLFLDNQFNIDKFDQYRMECLTSLCFAAPGLVGRYLIDELNGTNRSMRQQMDILSSLVGAAERLSTSSGLFDSKSIQADQMKLIRFSQKGINRFAPYASLFFYGISHRLKADVAGSQSLITTRPQSIMSSFRERIFENNGPAQLVLKNIKSEEPRNSLKPNRMVLSLDDENEDDRRSGNFDLAPKDIDSFLEQNSISDDSYLLSRILLSISNILSCSAQQPVTCKLSSDLLDILSAYRCHPDSGVQRTIVSCLKIIRDCTPSTYYSSYIEKRMLRSFGPWLAKIEPNVQRC